ncbi:hypothetical protein QJQ45_013058 [Haematococcus lacustris]|nr:hypothetical protein QJQ45_013058 [Haematococcus lacustris]
MMLKIDQPGLRAPRPERAVGRKPLAVSAAAAHVVGFLEERIRQAQLAARRQQQASCVSKARGILPFYILPKTTQFAQRRLQVYAQHPKRPRREVLRPGIPPATSTTAFRVLDRPSPPVREDDKDGHYVYELGENLTSRYKILSKMGEGTFGRVLECWDRKHKDYVAIKIVRNIDKYRHAAMIEVFEKLGPSLFDFLRKNEYRPFPIDLVQDFARQLICSVSYLHELQLVHTDLKPENILLVSLDYCRAASSGVVPASSSIKVIDFGSATFEDQYHSSIVSTRHYRAPEVILGMGWTYPCDLWSVGCIIIELLTGDALFQTHENLEHLAMMEQVLGPIPESLIQRSNKICSKYFVNNRLCWPDASTTKKSVKAVKKLTGLRRLILEHGDSSAVPHLDLLVDLLTELLRYEPEQRISASAALQHPFFQVHLPNSIPSSAQSSQHLQQGGGHVLVAQQHGSQVALATSVQQQASGLHHSKITPSVAPIGPGTQPSFAASGRNSAATTHYGW